MNPTQAETYFLELPISGGGGETASGPPQVTVQKPADRGEALAAAPVAPKPFLTPDESRELEICEGLIAEGMDKAVAVVVAMAAIRDKRLYRAELKTFEEYCEVRWSLKVRQAYRLLGYFDFLRTINGVPEGQVDVANWTQFTIRAPESQTRPFLGLPLEHRKAAWEEALATAPKGRMTARHGEAVARAWRQKLGGPVEPAAPAPAPAERAVPRASTRNGRVREALVISLAKAREAQEAGGTADSESAANLSLVIDHLQKLLDHLDRIDRMQESRPPGV